MSDSMTYKNYLYHDPNNTMKINNSYPHSMDYSYESYIEYINLDQECELDLKSNSGFIIAPSSKNIKKDIRSDDSIFSPKFGRTLADTNQFINRYKCSCPGEEGLQGRLNVGLTCPKCGKVCKFVDDNLAYFGWIKLIDPYPIIHPAFYKKLEQFFGKNGIAIQGVKRSKLENILDVSNAEIYLGIKPNDPKLKEEPFFGIGMIGLRERFDEVMEFYLKLNKNRKAFYDDIYANKEKIFTHSIPVFSTLLRAFEIDGGRMTYETVNGKYSKMNGLVTRINKCRTRCDRTPKIKNGQLYSLQKTFMDLYSELEAILSGKKGDFRCLLGGRYNFSSRNVIVQNPDLRIDQVTLPVIGLTVLLEQRIKNILCRMYNITPNEAHNIWYKACIIPNKNISAIIQSIIDDYKEHGIPGIPILINRNPTIWYGGILQMFCIGFTNTYTMEMPLQVLSTMNADFDGDVLNILLPINQTFIRLAWETFNPRNAMYISRNDGYFNSMLSMTRDTLINANSLARCGRDSYTPEEREALNKAFASQSSV